FGIFQNVGVADLFDVRARVEIRRCSDGFLVFGADSTIPELNVDAGQVKFGFPSKQGIYDIAKITPGCYNVCVIAKYPTDGDRTNDTACSQFSVIDRLHGQIEVGVGRRFTTISNAIDSMKFRGIGGNLTLILTDANYLETGTNLIVSPQNSPGLDDFSGIRGLTDTAQVTWVPKAGVSPRIVLRGNKSFGFYYAFRQSNYIHWDGNNQIIKTPDTVLAEPTKRGITIVDSLTKPGAVFAMEYGPNHINLRNLILIGNGNMTNPATNQPMYFNDSDAVVRLYDNFDQSTYIRGYRDTVALNHIILDNCQLGNARYGIWDKGVHPLFDLGIANFLDRRNDSNAFTRNTIGTQAWPLGTGGIAYDDEQQTLIAHNEIGWIRGPLAGTPNVFGISQMGAGNVVGMWIDANRIRNVQGTGTVSGIS